VRMEVRARDRALRARAAGRRGRAGDARARAALARRVPAPRPRHAGLRRLPVLAAVSAGYSGTPLPAKLGIKPGQRTMLVDAPRDIEASLKPALGATTRL